MDKRRLKMRSKELSNLAAELQDFHDKDLKQNRKQLYQAILKTIDKGFIRIDKGNVVELFRPDYRHSADIMIGNNDGKIHVDCWGLWKTIYGIEEQVQEMEAYERDF